MSARIRGKAATGGSADGTILSRLRSRTIVGGIGR